ncbi:MAG: CHAT domain-containing tetratricopeptide repeat protein [Thermoanaerobaculia bacterium]
MNARLTDLAYAPRPETKCTSSASVRAAASAILLRDRSAYARGTAFLVLDDSEAAVEQFREAARLEDSKALSDLGAAQVTEAEDLDAWEPAIDAIVATRRAIERSPKLAPAHFNLALALQRVGLMAEAYAEFEAAARLEPGSSWAAEALQRAYAIPRRAVFDEWKGTEQRLNVTSDPEARKVLILQNAYLARIQAEGPYLTLWADATSRGRAAEARAALDRASMIASVLRDASGERLAFDAVAAIDKAESSGRALAFAEAHLTYLQGRLARKNRDESHAIDLLSAAAVQLAAGNSPLQYVARYYVSGALYEQGRINEALAVLESLEAEALESRGYRGLAAQLGWEHGICLELRGDYAAALGIFDRSRAIADAEGEHDLAARFDGLAAEALEYLGESKEAWGRRSRALCDYARSGRSDIRTAVTLTSTAQIQIAGRNWSRAEVLLDYAIPIAAEAGDARVAAQAFAKRSVARDELHDPAGAARDRAYALRWAKRIDAVSRERLKIEINIAEGVALRVLSPRAAVTQFTAAIELLHKRGQTAFLPRLFFERARAQEAAGDLVGADNDLRSGIEVVDQWERSVPTIEQRAAIGVWSEAMRRDLIAHALTRGDVASAFAYADDRISAANLRTPPDFIRKSTVLREMQTALAHDAAVLEFVVIRGEVIIFVVRPYAAHAFRLPSSAVRIAAVADAMRRAPDEALSEAASSLYDLVLAPVWKSLRGAKTLVIIPVPELSAIPFGALRDRARNRYLIEDASIVLAQTASAAIASSRSTPRPGNGVIVIGSDGFDHRRHPDVLPLPNARREAMAIASLWRSGHALVGVDANVDRLRRDLPEAAVIHYAGHIVGRGTDSRLLLALEHNEDSLTSRDISEMPLRAKVVVLAACRGSGASSPQTIIGDMASGFLGAGAQAVIASATDVDDADSLRTMRRLHSFLVAGSDAAEAVRQTVIVDLAEGHRTPLSIRLMVHGGSQAVVDH